MNESFYRIEPVGQRPIEDSFGTVHVQAILFRNEGKIGYIDAISPGQEGAGVDFGNWEERQNGMHPVEDGLAALYFDFLDRVVICKKAYSCKIWNAGERFAADAVSLEEEIGGNQAEVNGRGRLSERCSQDLLKDLGKFLLLRIEIDDVQAFLAPSQSGQDGIMDFRWHQ